VSVYLYDSQVCLYIYYIYNNSETSLMADLRGCRKSSDIRQVGHLERSAIREVLWVIRLLREVFTKNASKRFLWYHSSAIREVRFYIIGHLERFRPLGEVFWPVVAENPRTLGRLDT